LVFEESNSHVGLDHFSSDARCLLQTFTSPTIIKQPAGDALEFTVVALVVCFQFNLAQNVIMLCYFESLNWSAAATFFFVKYKNLSRIQLKTKNKCCGLQSCVVHL